VRSETSPGIGDRGHAGPGDSGFRRGCRFGRAGAAIEGGWIIFVWRCRTWCPSLYNQLCPLSHTASGTFASRSPGRRPAHERTRESHRTSRARSPGVPGARHKEIRRGDVSVPATYRSCGLYWVAGELCALILCHVIVNEASKVAPGRPQSPILV
jgi:hypothetical protein